MADLDLTPFGFTPTESRVYEVMLRHGPGTGYTIARAAGLARANTYSALEGLVSKGAALQTGDRPKRYRPESPDALLARITSRQGEVLEELSRRLVEYAATETETLVPIDSPRGALQVMSHEIARAASSVRLLVPPDAYPILAPTLRRVVTAGLPAALLCTGPVTLEFTEVRRVDRGDWPGDPVLLITDDRTAVIAARRDGKVEGHWSRSASFVAAARRTFEQWPTT